MKAWLSAYLKCPCNALRKQCQVSENWFTQINLPVSELMSHSTMFPLSTLSVHEFRYLFLIMGLLSHCGMTLKTKLQIDQMKNNKDPVGRHDSQNTETKGLHAKSQGMFASLCDQIFLCVPQFV